MLLEYQLDCVKIVDFLLIAKFLAGEVTQNVSVEFKNCIAAIVNFGLLHMPMEGPNLQGPSQ